MATERYAISDVRVGDVTIPRGALVYVALDAANHDEDAFRDAARFDIARQPIDISRSDTASTTVWARRSRAWRDRSQFACSRNASKRSN